MEAWQPSDLRREREGGSIGSGVQNLIMRLGTCGDQSAGRAPEDGVQWQTAESRYFYGKVHSEVVV